MDVILAFPLNNPSVLLIYRYSILHVSAKFGVKVKSHESLYAITFLPISSTVSVSWSLILWAFKITPKYQNMLITRETCCVLVLGKNCQQLLPWQHFPVVHHF